MNICENLKNALKNAGCADCYCCANYIHDEGGIPDADGNVSTRHIETVTLKAVIIGEALLSLSAYVPSLGCTKVFDNIPVPCSNDVPFEIIGRVICYSCNGPDDPNYVPQC